MVLEGHNMWMDGPTYDTKTIKCAWRKYQRRACLHFCRLYIFLKLYTLWHAILVVKINALLCFLLLYRYLVIGNNKLGQYLYNYFTRWWPTTCYHIIEFHQISIMFGILFLKVQSKKKGKDQESIQSSTTLNQGYQ